MITTLGKVAVYSLGLFSLPLLLNFLLKSHNRELTLYSLHRTVRDIQRDTVARNNDMAQLEEKIANLKLNESKRRAQASNAGFSVEDLTDSENDEEEDLEYKPATTQYTARYLRRFNFLNDVCIKSSRRTPLQCPVDI